jgi:rod shape-determining protein MreC
MALAIDTRRSRFLLVGLVLLHLAVIAHQVDSGSGVSLLRRAVFTVLSPIEVAFASAVRGVASAWHGWVDLRQVHRRNERLEQQVRYLETLLQERQHQARESERLREVLGMREHVPLQTVAAEVVARGGVPWFRTLTVDRGRAAGVALDSAVLSPKGVVGRVVEVGPYAAKIQLLQDRESGAGVVVERSRVSGVVIGQVGFADAGPSDLLLKYVPGLADVVVGDVIVTSGTDGIYPKGFQVGTVSFVGPGQALFKEILVTPSVRPDEIETVLVVKGAAPATTFDESVK